MPYSLIQSEQTAGAVIEPKAVEHENLELTEPVHSALSRSHIRKNYRFWPGSN